MEWSEIVRGLRFKLFLVTTNGARPDSALQARHRCWHNQAAVVIARQVELGQAAAQAGHGAADKKKRETVG